MHRASHCTLLNVALTSSLHELRRATKGQFWGCAECRLVLVDTRSGVVYSNLAAQSDRGLFDFAPR